MRRRPPMVPLLLATTMLAACATPSPRALAATEPAGRVLLRLDPARDLKLVRDDGRTVHVRDVTSVVGHLRATRGDTAWLEASRLRTRGDDRPQPVPGWTLAIVTDSTTRPVPIPNDVVLGHRGSVTLGVLATTTMLALAALIVVIGSAGRGD